MLDAEVEYRCVWLMFSAASLMEVGFCAKEIPSLYLFLSLLAYFFIIVLSIPLGFELAFLVLHVHICSKSSMTILIEKSMAELFELIQLTNRTLHGSRHASNSSRDKFFQIYT